MTLSRMEVPEQIFEKGYKDGHADGKNRVGVYTTNEEFDIASQAANSVELSPGEIGVWLESFCRERYESGYSSGYRLGASGEPLPE